jgi:Protein of unknown function (DUF3768)
MSGNQNEMVKKIRDLNDAFRTTGIGGRIMLTIGIRELGKPTINEIITKVRNFTDFNKNNDPHGEHDLGLITHNGVKVLWKLDYYDRNLEFGSPDPSDASITTRVMTVMSADEY